MKRILILFLSLLPLFSVAKTFEGRIVEKLSNKKEAPLPGASVFWKNTTIGTATDADGHFTLNKSNKSDILVVQFVGYETREVEVKTFDGKELLIELSPNIALDEVVVSKRRMGTIIDRENPIQSQSITGTVTLLRVSKQMHRLMSLMLMQLREPNRLNFWV